jgi:nitroreductase
MLDRALLEELLAEVRLAPSVHNIQPTRWRPLGEDKLLLLEDVARRLPAADPSGHDVRLSHGAAIEGLSLAFGRRGLRIAEVEPLSDAPVSDGLLPVAHITIAAGGELDGLADFVSIRMSWRGGFRPFDQAGEAALYLFSAMAGDVQLVRGAETIDAIARLADEAGFHFLCEDAHRAELLHWMRLSRSDPAYERDGLSAEAMAMPGVVAFGTRLVLGPLFPLLRRLGLAATLASERGKFANSAVALFHRPEGEDPLAIGRAFYRAWLMLTAQGLAACPVSVLADWPASNRQLAERYGVPAGRRLVNVFRLGLAAGTSQSARARLPVAELIV